jgi:hypothetical protein
MENKFEKVDFDWGQEFDMKSLKEIRHIINALSDKYGESAILELDYCWDTMTFSIMVEREETEEEKATRLKKEQKKVEADRKRYENLKAKYGWT